MNKVLKSFFGSIFAISSVVQAQTLDKMDDEIKNQMIVDKKIACEQNDNAEGCIEVDEQFRILISSDNVDAILEMYRKKQVQLEMQYDGRTGR